MECLAGLCSAKDFSRANRVSYVCNIKILDYQTHFSMCRKQLTVATVDAAKLLVKYLFGKLTGTFNHHLDVLKASISLLLIVLCKTQVLVSKNVMDESNATDVLGMCELTLRGWVADHNVIGGSFFGGTVHNSWIGSKKELVYALPELKVWMILHVYTCIYMYTCTTLHAYS